MSRPLDETRAPSVRITIRVTKDLRARLRCAGPNESETVRAAIEEYLRWALKR